MRSHNDCTDISEDELNASIRGFFLIGYFCNSNLFIVYETL